MTSLGEGGGFSAMTDTLTLELPPLYRTPIQTRSATVSALDADQRIIELCAVPYGVETRLSPSLVESFAARAFSNASKDPGRVKLWHGHSTVGGQIVGGAELVEDKPDGVYIRARVSHTAAGDDLLTLAHDGVLDEASVEFQPIPADMAVTRRGDDTVVRHKRARLLGVALVPHGAYGRGAVVLSVRDEATDRLREEWLAKLRCRTA
jgi:HK97 family phage prohead protease